jgi:HD-GYP domain-containing protein (c-di-GMP phosphodiesterase class II)/HAMP domain-containing protein
VPFQIDRAFLRSKVGRRIFLLFIACALIPIGGLAVLSFGLVSRELSEHSRERLHQAAKSAGMAIVQRLYLLDTTLERLVFHVDKGIEEGFLLRQEFADQELRPSFESLSLASRAGEVEPVYGSLRNPPELDKELREHIKTGRPALVVRNYTDGTVELYMYKVMDPLGPSRGILVGKIAANDLWSTDTLPPMTELTVLDQDGRTLFSSLPDTGTTEDYIAISWTMPLKFTFGVPHWTVVLSESRAEVLAPMTNFKILFPLVIIVSLCLVALLSLGQIRRNLVPLEKLREGTRRVAEGDFGSGIEVASGDEFEELAGSFNSMANQLGRQFSALGTMAELDRAILSTWSTRGIVDAVLDRLPDLFPCDSVAVTVFDSESRAVARSYIEDTGSKGESDEALFEIEPPDQRDLSEMSEAQILNRGHFPAYLAPLEERGIESALVLPVFSKGRVSAVITLAHRQSRSYSRSDEQEARQIADRVAVALSNARLVEELDRLNWGTLIALARTIDAKSHWTAGHSERGAELALKIGRIMGLERQALDDLHRGALLHDIGKIAIPPAILDKEAALSDEELKMMQDHPKIGARILEPIGAYASAIPVVAQHHEWWDGSGYPKGFAGDEIDLLARIFAVADVYDALISDRPYRVGLSHDEVVDFIKDKAGTQFAPPVVDAFVEVMRREGDQPQKGSYHASPLLST